MTSTRQSEIEAVIAGIAKEHEDEGSGNGLIRHLGEWLRSAARVG